MTNPDQLLASAGMEFHHEWKEAVDNESTFLGYLEWVEEYRTERVFKVCATVTLRRDIILKARSQQEAGDMIVNNPDMIGFDYPDCPSDVVSNDSHWHLDITEA